MPLIDNQITSTDLANQSLGMIGNDPIDSIDGTDKISVKVRRAYVVARDSLLRLRPWNCATTRQALNSIANPSKEYAYCYQLPTDPYFLRTIKLESGCRKYRVEGRKLLTDELSPVLVYVCRVDAHEMDAMLFEVLVAKLASTLAGTLLKDHNHQVTLMKVVAAMLDDAVGVDEAEQGEGHAFDLRDDR